MEVSLYLPLKHCKDAVGSLREASLQNDAASLALAGSVLDCTLGTLSAGQLKAPTFMDSLG